MCTLIVATGVWRQTPLLVAANRDEKLDRPAEPPRFDDLDGMRILAPRDRQAGGTWLGINAAGVLAAITNRFTGLAPPVAPRSRGLLVLDALRWSSAERSAETIAALDPEQHAPFHLIAADRDAAHLVWSDGKELRHEPLVPGIHVVTERSLGAAPTRRRELIDRAVRSVFTRRRPEPEDWAEILRTRGDPPSEGICVHDPARRYGTRSSTIVYLGATAAEQRLLHAEGPPDTTPYVDLSPALRELLR